MNILALDVLDLFGDGTLVMKTTVDQPGEAVRYAWYVKERGRNIGKSHYQASPYMGFRLEHLGRYVIKAFVRDEQGQVITAEAEFAATKKTSPQLSQVKKAKFQVTPVISHVSGPFWKFSVSESFDGDTKYAWYVFREGEDQPFMKKLYESDSNTIHKFETPGNYYVKAFVIHNGVKCSANSEVFTVSA